VNAMSAVNAISIETAKHDSPIRILFADDESRILDEYVHVLDGAGNSENGGRALSDLEAELFGQNEVDRRGVHYELCLCRQANEAVERVEEAIRDGRPFAIAFLDVRMPPGPDGDVAAERIRKLDHQVNIVFVTGYSDTPLEQIASRVPPADKLLYLQSPCMLRN
jgi:two-component system, cell cycle sensor histidine kinase and response regulator CckA